MTDEEATVESTADDRRAAGLPGDGYDDAAESFLELEADLDADLGGTDTGRDTRRGLVVDGDRIDASEVPDGYPIAIRGEEALALTVDRGDGETTAYVAWPGDGSEDARLPWLLDAMGIGLGDLYGRTVLLDRVDGHDVLVTPTERPRGSGAWGLGVAAGHVLNATLLAVAILGSVSLPALPVFLVWLSLTLVWLPYATYRDGWYLRTHSEWDGGPLFWATLSGIPLVNVIAGVGYFWERTRATFFGDDPSLCARLVGVLRSLLSV